MSMPKGKGKKSDSNKVEKLQQKVDGITLVMQQNIDLAVERGALLEDLVDSTGQLAHEAQLFTADAVRLEEKSHFQNLTFNVVLGGIALGLLYGAFSGFYWPFLLVAGAVGGLSGYMLMKMIFGIKQAYDRFATVDGLQHELSTRVAKKAHLPYIPHPHFQNTSAPRSPVTPYYDEQSALQTPQSQAKLIPSRGQRFKR